MNDVVLNKIQIVQRCVQRAREEFGEGGETFRRDFSRQDAAVMNVVRACEATIDLANLVVRRQRAGIPNTSAESFRLLARVGVLDEALAERLAPRVGFRNVAVHAYQQLDLGIRGVGDPRRPGGGAGLLRVVPRRRLLAHRGSPRPRKQHAGIDDPHDEPSSLRRIAWSARSAATAFALVTSKSGRPGSRVS